MASLNKAMIIGRLGVDPELRYTQNNRAVVTLKVATDSSYTDKSGEKVENTEWHRVVVWGKQAESCDRYLKKGRLVYVEGNIQTRKWQDKDGNDRYITEIRAQRVQFLDRGDGKEKAAGGGGQPPHPAETEAGFDQSFSDDDIPF